MATRGGGGTGGQQTEGARLGQIYRSPTKEPFSGPQIFPFLWRPKTSDFLGRPKYKVWGSIRRRILSYLSYSSVLYICFSYQVHVVHFERLSCKKRLLRCEYCDCCYIRRVYHYGRYFTPYKVRENASVQSSFLSHPYLSPFRGESLVFSFLFPSNTSFLLFRHWYAFGARWEEGRGAK